RSGRPGAPGVRLGDAAVAPPGARASRQEVGTEMTARKTRAIVVGGLSAGLLLAAAACSSGGGGSSGGAGGSNSGGHITIGVAAGTGPANALLAQQLGYFKSAGLYITFKTLNGGGAEAVAGMQSGSLQIAESNVVSV